MERSTHFPTGINRDRRHYYKDFYKEIRKPRKPRAYYVRNQIQSVQVGNRELERSVLFRTLKQRWRNRPGKDEKKPINIFRVFKAHEIFPDFIGCIETRSNDKFGNHIVSNQDLNVGQIIAISKPFASVVNKTNDPYCLTCHELDNVFIPCGECSAVNFCSMECKMNNKAHKYECRSNFHDKKYDNISNKLAIQIILEALAIFKGNVKDLKIFVDDLVNKTNIFQQREVNQINDEKTRLQCIMTLQSIPSEKVEYGNVIEAFDKIWDLPRVRELFEAKEAKQFILQFLAHNIAVIQPNGFQTTLKGTHGNLIYDSFSLFNHSCSPNVFNIMRGNIMVGITGRHIKSGEQLFISYCYMGYEKKEKRRKVLKKHWNFTCDCERCRDVNEITEAELKAEKAKDDLYQLEKELNDPIEYNHERGVQMLVYREQLRSYSIDNKIFLKV